MSVNEYMARLVRMMITDNCQLLSWRKKSIMVSTRRIRNVQVSTYPGTPNHSRDLDTGAFLGSHLLHKKMVGCLIGKAQYRPQSTIILIMGTPKLSTMNFANPSNCQVTIDLRFGDLVDQP